ncbi:MAG: autotransporter-associated beta strand repeat-containing protein [Pirellulales bacterium]
MHHACFARVRRLAAHSPLVVAMLAMGLPAARADTIEVDTVFSGTINAGDDVYLIAPDGSIGGPVTNNGSLWFNNPDIPTVTVSSPISGSGAVVFLQPVNVTMSATNSYTGGTYIYSGTVGVTGALLGGGGALEVSGASPTLLSIAGPVTNGDASLAVGPGEFGDVTVGPGGSWSSGELSAGRFGTTTVTVSGGSVSAGTTYFARLGGSVGNLVLTSGSFVSSDSIYFGNEGTSNLNVSGGRLSAANQIYIGYQGLATGTLSSGTLSSGTISAGGTLYVGTQSVGTLTVNGGSLSSNAAIIGQSTGGVGTVTMNASLWQVTNDLEVGSTNGGVGNLIISGGGVTSGRGLVGYLAGSTGNVTVSSGSWSTTGADPDGTLHVGYFGTGTMTITGGTVSAIGASIGFNSTGDGTLIVNGGVLSVANLTNIGYYARGDFQLLSGSVSTGQVVVGGQNFVNQGRGSVTVSGGDWYSSLSLTVGQGGNGTYTQTGGNVSAARGYIGSADLLATGGTGSVLVTGGTLAYRGNLDLGNPLAASTGAGTLTIGGGGYVSVADTLARAANGTLNLNTGGTLSIGVGGATGSLPTDVLNNGLLIFNRQTDYSYVNAISGTGAVQKYGNATLTITGSNTYSGATDVFSGTMSVVGQLGNTAVRVYGGSTLIGTGSIAGPVLIDANGTLRPGVGGVGTLTVGNYTMSGSAALAVMQISGSNVSQYDRVVAQVASNLQWGSGSLAFSMFGTPSYVDGTEFYLFSGFGDYAGTITGISFDGTGTTFAGLSFADAGDGLWQTGRNSWNQYLEFNTATGTLVVVPEPAAMLPVVAGIVCGTAVLRGRRRRARRNQST